MFTPKLDSRTVGKWKEYRNSLDDIPSLEHFNKFIIGHAEVLELIE